MRSRSGPTLTILAILLASALPLSPAAAVASDERYVVGFDPGAPLPTDALGGRIVGRSDALGFLIVEGIDPDAARIDPRVRYVERDTKRPLLHFTPNDPQYGSQHAPQAVRLPLAWDVTRGDTSAAVCIVDSGARLTHQDLAASRYLGGRDFVENDDTPQDGDGHGTHVLGIAAASVHNGMNIAGAGNVGYFVARVLDDQGEGTFATVAQGIQWCVDRAHPRVVISLSLGCGTGSLGNATHRHGSGEPCNSQPVRDAIANAFTAGRLVVASAGNDGPCYTCVGFPARLPGVLSVGCSDGSAACFFSSTGNELALVAPGASVLSLGHASDSATATLSGTSMSAPLVAGAAALYWSHDHAITMPALRDRVLRSSADLGAAGWDKSTGCGRLDVKRLFDGTLSSCALPPPPACNATPANDCFVNAAPLLQENGDFLFSNVGATDEPDEEHPCDLGASVWFKFTADRSERAWVYPWNHPPRTSAAIYESIGPTITDLAYKGCSDGFPRQSGPAHIEFDCVAGRTYYLQVGGNWGEQGTINLHLDLCSTGPKPPTVPRDLVATGQNAIGAVSLTWREPANDGERPILAYRLERAPAPTGSCPTSGFTLVETLPASARSASESGLPPATTVCYRLIATNEIGESPPAATTVLVPGLPAVPAAPVATGGSGSVRLTWQAPPHWGGVAPVGFGVYVANSPSGPFTLAATPSPSAREYVVDGLAPGTTRAFKVSAVNAIGEGDATAVVSAASASVPTAPIGFRATTGLVPFSIELDWSTPASSGGSPITKYEIFRDGSLYDETTASARRYVDGGLGPFEMHNYSVRAVNAIGPGVMTLTKCADSFDWPSFVAPTCR